MYLEQVQAWNEALGAILSVTLNYCHSHLESDSYHPACVREPPNKDSEVARAHADLEVGGKLVISIV